MSRSGIHGPMEEKLISESEPDRLGLSSRALPVWVICEPQFSQVHNGDKPPFFTS